MERLSKTCLCESSSVVRTDGSSRAAHTCKPSYSAAYCSVISGSYTVCALVIYQKYIEA